MTVRKKSSSASDVLRQEMQQPLVIPERIVPASDRNHKTEPNPTTTNTNMNPPNDDTATIAQLKAAQEKESKLQQQHFEALTKELKDAKEMIVKLAEQGQAPAKGKTSAMVKKDTSRSNASITARPTESREETARRRANIDIGWLD
ncbi:MAG: hypothetical protein LH613_06930 [Chamaesiphon sp.]|nr:hypothetical protein [Chamaesiphon sp.]